MRPKHHKYPQGRVVWLWCWLGVMVVGCSQNTGPGPTPQPNTLALLSLTRVSITSTPLFRLLRTPTSWTTNRVIQTLAPTPMPLQLSPPTCYETAISTLWCLGQVHNNLLVPVEQISVRVYLVTADGTALDTQATITARSDLPPGETSPYGVLFTTIPEGDIGPVAVLESAVQSNTGGRIISLVVQGVHSDSHDSIYHITGMLVNTSPITLHKIMVVVTLIDAHEQVTGFRQLHLPSDQKLAAGLMLPFMLDVLPQGTNTVRFEVSAEGQTD